MQLSEVNKRDHYYSGVILALRIVKLIINVVLDAVA